MAWRILLYHDVNWEESPALRGLGGSVTPETFRRHVAAARAMGDVVAPDEAIRRLGESPRENLISFWFDDGLAGVRRYALPILAELGLVAAAAVCSRFYRREEMFWRFQLSHLAALGLAASLRTSLRERGLVNGEPLRDAVMKRFSPDVLAAIGAAYSEVVSAAERKAAFRVFMAKDDLISLQRAGWTVANHTAAHHQVGDDRGLAALKSQFDECDRALTEDLGDSPRFWVLPFDRDRSDRLIDHVRTVAPERWLVLVGDRETTAADTAARVLHRFFVPPAATALELRRLLKGS